MLPTPLEHAGSATGITAVGIAPVTVGQMSVPTHPDKDVRSLVLFVVPFT
jgi:hypothetical protein